jgi:nitroreductase
MNLDPKMIAAGIQSRRTVKPPHYSERRISREDMDWILEQAAWAPTHGKTEPWRFRVYTGSTLEDLSGDLIRLYHAATPPDEVDNAKIKKLEVNPLHSSHALLLSSQTGINPKMTEIEDTEASACAVHNLCLAARSKGIASFWSTGAMIYHEEATRIFCLEPDKILMGVLYLGYPKSTWPKAVRAPAASYVRWMD